MLEITLTLITIWIISGFLLSWLFWGDELYSLWIEPMLSHPILIFESDDWGAGPQSQITALDEIINTLSKYQDPEGNNPVWTIAVILSLPDVKKIVADNYSTYHEITLLDESFKSVLEKLIKLQQHNNIYLHLHGKEHFWPETIMKKLQENDPDVMAWLHTNKALETEKLPSYLQSRWIDAKSLPSKKLTTEAIQNAVKEEVKLFEQCFNHVPESVVPPTFVWTKEVEKRWHENGVKILVNPGHRYETRNQEGKVGDSVCQYNFGELLDSGLYSIVRNCFFEPSLGHTEQSGSAIFDQKVQEGRAVLFETHRFNFLDENKRTTSIQEMDKLIKSILKKHPMVRFTPPSELLNRVRSGNNLETRLSRKVFFWFNRLKSEYRLWRNIRMFGWGILVQLLLAFRVMVIKKNA